MRAATLLYFSPLLILNNPFFAVPAPLKFSIAGAALFGSAALVFSNRGTFNVSWRLILFALFLAVAAVRLNPVYDLSSDLVRMQIGFSIVILVAGGLAFRHLPMSELPRTILILTTPYIAMIALYRDALLYEFDTTYHVGDLTADSYLSTGYFFGLFTFVCIYYMMSAPTIRTRVLSIAAILPVLYLSLYNPARGELLAMLACMALMIAPRLTILAAAILPLLYSLVQRIVFAYDFPVLERLRPVFDGDNYGLRDQLFTDAIEYILSSTSVLLFGGGGNAFQFHFDHEPGLYPHNLYLDALTTGGVVLAAFVVSITLLPICLRVLWLVFNPSPSPLARFLTAICVFNLLIVMKAGSILTIYHFYLFLPLFSTRVRTAEKSCEPGADPQSPECLKPS